MDNKKVSSNQFHIRIKNTETLDKILIAKKINKDKTFNDILNTAIEYGLDILLDESSYQTDTFSDKLEKNTNKILRKVNDLQNQNQKELIKITILSSVQEAMLSYLMNSQDYKLKMDNIELPDGIKKQFFEDSPALVNEFKQALINDLFGEDSYEN